MARKASPRQRLVAFCVPLVFVGIALTGNVCAASCLSPGDRALPPGEERPGNHPEFREGFRAFQRGNWREAAQWMCKAEERWPEDGESTRTHGRRFFPYLPRYYLGIALYEIGCYQAALNQFNASILHQREVRNTERERKTLLLHKEECTERVRRGEFHKTAVDCSEWLNPEDPERANESEGHAPRPDGLGASGGTEALLDWHVRLRNEEAEIDQKPGRAYHVEERSRE